MIGRRCTPHLVKVNFNKFRHLFLSKQNLFTQFNASADFRFIVKMLIPLTKIFFKNDLVDKKCYALKTFKESGDSQATER